MPRVGIVGVLKQCGCHLLTSMECVAIYLFTIKFITKLVSYLKKEQKSVSWNYRVVRLYFKHVLAYYDRSGFDV